MVFIPPSSSGSAKKIQGVSVSSTAPTANQVLTASSATAASWAAGGLISTTQYAPQGFLINGKIVVTVASNNITVAIKGLDGNDPSASNPVYCRINDTVRTITAALSVTKNAGTNWFGSGGVMFAAREIDYFAYLGYNATDGVVIGFARIPYATQYSSFSATTTNEAYCAISTITNAASTDYYEVVGRFAATLSGTAAFNWSVPTYTSINLIQRPIYETRTLTYLPTYDNNGIGTWSASNTQSYKMVGGLMFLPNWYATGTIGGTASNTPRGTLPFTAATASTLQMSCRVDNNGAVTAGWFILIDTTHLGFQLTAFGNFTNGTCAANVKTFYEMI